MPARISKLSAVVICYNRIDVIEACLIAARNAEELIVIDKSSTDGTDEIGRKYADKFYRVPWSPVVEDTRAFAVSKAAGEWILLLDDDECLNIEAIDYIAEYIHNPLAPVCSLPRREYILGRHDERAYYWPQHHARLFRADAVRLPQTVHGGIEIRDDKFYRVPADHGAAILHLSHADAHTWIEKTNRYTSIADRKSKASADQVTPAGMRAILEQWLEKIPKEHEADQYLCAVAALRAMYDIADAIKLWESRQSGMGQGALIAAAQDLIAEYRAREQAQGSD